MTDAGERMTGSAISKIEHGGRAVTLEELVAFSYVLERPLVRLMTPPSDASQRLRLVDQAVIDPTGARNFFVYGHSSSKAARGSQEALHFAYSAMIFLDESESDERKRLAREEVKEFLASKRAGTLSNRVAKP
jgi:hypothetical protein